MRFYNEAKTMVLDIDDEVPMQKLVDALKTIGTVQSTYRFEYRKPDVPEPSLSWKQKLKKFITEVDYFGLGTAINLLFLLYGIGIGNFYGCVIPLLFMILFQQLATNYRRDMENPDGNSKSQI